MTSSLALHHPHRGPGPSIGFLPSAQAKIKEEP